MKEPVVISIPGLKSIKLKNNKPHSKLNIPANTDWHQMIDIASTIEDPMPPSFSGMMKGK